MTKEQLKEIIESSLTNCNATILSDDNVHFQADIRCDEFNDVTNRVKRQQLVYKVIDKYIASGEVHAISMKTKANK